MSAKHDDEDDYYLDSSYYDPWEEDPPLYRSGELAAMSEAALQKEWDRQCNTHDYGVDRLPMRHPTIEDAAARLRLVEAEQKRRGFAVGPAPDGPGNGGA